MVRRKEFDAVCAEDYERRVAAGEIVGPLSPLPAKQLERITRTDTVEFKQVVADSMEWENFKKYVPAGAEMEEATKKLLEDMKNEPPAVRAAMMPHINIFLGNVLRVVGLVKAKQAEKPAQVNTQVNIDRGGFNFGPDEEQPKASPARRAKGRAKTSPSEPATACESADPTPTSPPSQEAGGTQAGS